MPSEAELQPLVGQEIGQICLAPFSLQVSFDRWGMTIEFKIEHVEPDGSRHAYSCREKDKPPTVLHRLLQKVVVSIERQDLTFTLRFDDGSALIVHTEIGPYECGQLYRMDDPTGALVF